MFTDFLQIVRFITILVHILIMNILDKLQILRERYKSKAQALIDKYDKLQIIYLRVSTKSLGQEESDQLPQVLQIFDLKEEECLIIKEKKSAYQLNKQKYRKINLIKELIEELKDETKYLYMWDLDRLYRNQDLQVNFIRDAYSNNCTVLTYRQNWLYELRGQGGMGKALYNFMIEVFGYMAQDESEKKGDRLTKSLTAKDGRYYTNKGNMFGNKYRSVKTGNALKLSATRINAIEHSILKKIKEGMKYRAIIELVEERIGIKISLGQITNIKKKYL